MGMAVRMQVESGAKASKAYALRWIHHGDLHKAESAGGNTEKNSGTFLDSSKRLMAEFYRLV